MGKVNTTSALLPAEARAILQRAYNVRYSSEFERRRLIDAAIARVKRLYPQYFK